MKLGMKIKIAESDFRTDVLKQDASGKRYSDTVAKTKLP